MPGNINSNNIIVIVIVSDQSFCRLSHVFMSHDIRLLLHLDFHSIIYILFSFKLLLKFNYSPTIFVWQNIYSTKYREMSSIWNMRSLKDDICSKNWTTINLLISYLYGDIIQFRNISHKYGTTSSSFWRCETLYSKLDLPKMKLYLCCPCFFHIGHEHKKE